MKISTMLLNIENGNVKPMQMVSHPDYTRAAYIARSNGADTPLDAFLRRTIQIGDRFIPSMLHTSKILHNHNL